MSAEVVTVEKELPTAKGAVESGSLLAAIARAASDPATDIEKMERLFAMHQQMVKADAETAFHAAMARCQSMMQAVMRNKRNEQTNSNYADLASIVDAIKPIYTAEGFSISFDTQDAPKENYLRVIAILAHSQGHSRTYHLDLPPDESGIKGTVNKTRVHATGSTNSYARRYLICMAFNIQTADDRDGNGSKKVMPDGQRADFKASVETIVDLQGWKELWAKILEASTACGDIQAHEELRSLMANKRKNLK